VVVYNSLSWKRSTVIHLPVSMVGMYNVGKIGGDDGLVKNAKSYPSSQGVSDQRASQVISFLAGPLPSLGASVYKVAFVGNITDIDGLVRGPDESIVTQREILGIEHSKDVEASNGLFSVVFDG
jgi:hypothetical protein